MQGLHSAAGVPSKRTTRRSGPRRGKDLTRKLPPDTPAPSLIAPSQESAGACPRRPQIHREANRLESATPPPPGPHPSPARGRAREGEASRSRRCGCLEAACGPASRPPEPPSLLPPARPASPRGPAELPHEHAPGPGRPSHTGGPVAPALPAARLGR